MLESFNPKNGIGYIKLTEDEMTKRGILGRLVGIIADYKEPTRNGRHYSEDLWDKVFENPIMEEKIDNRCLFGELGHPENRLETDIEKVAICLAEKPKKGTDGKIYGVFDILNTPNGKILKALCDYGCNIGVSSRGEGDVEEDFYGNESVDASSYDCQGWDAVLLPAVKSARPVYVTESLKQPLKAALQEAMRSSTPEAQKIMKESLDNLKIDYQATQPVDIDADSKSMEAGDAGSLVEELQQSVKENAQLKKTILDLNEKLSVCSAKENSDRTELEHYKQCVISLSEQARSAKALKVKLTQLEEEVKSKDDALKDLQESNGKLLQNKRSLMVRQSKLTESCQNNVEKVRQLEEEICELKSTIESLNEQLTIKTSEKKSTQKKLDEALVESKKFQISESDYSYKLQKANKLVEKYKSIAKVAIDKYIVLEANKIGVQPQQIKNRLNEGYSFDDIDRVCDELSQYKLKIDQLPFALSENNMSGAKMQIKESVQPSIISNKFDDSIDSGLLSLANLH